MLTAYNYQEFLSSSFLKKESNKTNRDIMDSVKKIIDDIQDKGDRALLGYIEKFDGVIPENLLVSREERKAAWKLVDTKTITALRNAAENIKSFHQKQLQNSRIMQQDENIYAGQLYRPIERVGIYVPGGTASYPSSVLMNAIPAVLAGVENVSMATPVRNGQPINPVLLVAADIVGVHNIYKVGGVQAIAAFAYGTETIPSVDKIVGPGNAYVAAAKALVYGDVGIDMIAGPSEVAIVADESANASYVAADLIAQAEHDPSARAILFSLSAELIDRVNDELKNQCSVLPREEIATEALNVNGASVLVSDIDQAFELCNAVAPEHLEIQTERPLECLGKVKHAGSVFLGHYTPEALGDYYAGPNHVLPTSGTAKFSSGLSVDDFIKKTTFLYYSEAALKDASEDVMQLAKQEQLEGHSRAIEKRIK
ncbi:histidinol dehydrogenase [Saliterribacillus persicus]|uniref:Histidinol dehydrogenase n=1 Tax=Saliterribacillus persicus TaxID=930114 RepID=A0A368X6Z7_9BACI|nr:histidinol dehydrogenase [Saliterribacillus persicus]RCW63770.1 histidinol dehydrogenase [Saliterribacillus persicus]